MKLLRILFLPGLLALSGCAALTPRSWVTYTKFRVTNHRGELIADWIAEGSFSPTPDGYSIKAVERTSGPPYSQTTRYPNGWRTTVAGPNIVYWRAGKPYWLYEIDKF